MEYPNKVKKIQKIYTHIEGLSPKEPYISHLNESALQVLNLGGAGSEASVEGEYFPPQE